MRKTIIAALLLSTHAMAASHSEQRHHYIRDFRYVSCGENTCIQLRSEGAFVSLFGGAFSTEGETELKILDRDGNLISSHRGKEASYSPSLKLITLSSGDIGFQIYSLKSEKLSSYFQKQSGEGK